VKSIHKIVADAPRVTVLPIAPTASIAIGVALIVAVSNHIEIDKRGAPSPRLFAEDAAEGVTADDLIASIASLNQLHAVVAATTTALLDCLGECYPREFLIATLTGEL